MIGREILALREKSEQQQLDAIWDRGLSDDEARVIDPYDKPYKVFSVIVDDNIRNYTELKKRPE